MPAVCWTWPLVDFISLVRLHKRLIQPHDKSVIQLTGKCSQNSGHKKHLQSNFRSCYALGILAGLWRNWILELFQSLIQTQVWNTENNPAVRKQNSYKPMRLMFWVISQSFLCWPHRESASAPCRPAPATIHMPFCFTGKALRQRYVRMEYMTELLSETRNKGL